MMTSAASMVSSESSSPASTSPPSIRRPLVRKPSAADMHIAVASKNCDAILQFVRRGADINAKVKGVTPLGACIYSGFLEGALLFISLDVDVNATSVDHVGREESPLCAATRLGLLLVVEALLKKKSCKRQRRDLFGKTPLWLATQQRRADIAYALVTSGARAGSSSVGDCPLHLCARYGSRTWIAQLLLATHKPSEFSFSDPVYPEPAANAMMRDDNTLLRALKDYGPVVPSHYCTASQNGAALQNGAAPEDNNPTHAQGQQQRPCRCLTDSRLISQPVSLQFECRRTLYGHLFSAGSGMEEFVEAFNLPHILKDYLLLTEMKPPAFSGPSSFRRNRAAKI